jgi:quinolinate synthase
VLDALADSEMILWGSSCGVHTIFNGEMCRWWQARGWRALVHPESPLDAVEAADGAGSTDFLWNAVLDAKPGDKLVIGTEGHFVQNARELGRQRGVEVMHLADLPADAVDASGRPFQSIGCGCATMSRNDPPHLAGMLDLLRQGKAPEINRVLAGDSVDERTMRRDRLPEAERAELTGFARASLERMIEIVEAQR